MAKPLEGFQQRNDVNRFEISKKGYGSYVENGL